MKIPSRVKAKLVVAKERGHLLHSFVVCNETEIEAMPLVMCLRCGQYMQGRCHGLKESCDPGNTARAGRLRKALKGHHPTQKGTWVKYSHPVQASPDAWTSGERRQSGLGIVHGRGSVLHGVHDVVVVDDCLSSIGQSQPHESGQCRNVVVGQHEQLHGHDCTSAQGIQGLRPPTTLLRAQGGLNGGDFDDPNGSMISESD